MVRVTLDSREQLMAAMAGIMRRISAIRKGRKEPYGTPKADLWGNDIESSGAEAAVAKALNLYWTSVKEKVGPGDVGNFEVRSTNRADGSLIVHDRDPDDVPFILVRGTFPDYEIVGWMFGRDAKDEKYRFRGDGRPAFFVPGTHLRDVEELLND